MNKSKIILLRDFIILIATLIMLALAIIAVVSGDSRPRVDSVSYIIGLSIPVIVILSLLLTIYWSFRKSYLVILPLLAIAINYNSILDNLQVRFRSESSATPPENIIRISSFNIHEFIYEKDITSISKLSDFLEVNKIDIICFQEFNTPGFLNIDELSSSFNLLPYSYIKEAKANAIGMSIFSRFPIIQSGRIDFKDSGNGAIWADLQIGDTKRIRVINNHLQTTNLTRNRDAKMSRKVEHLMINSVLRAEQADKVRSFIDSTNIPVIVCGDLNDTPLSYTFSRIKGSRLVDGFREAGLGLGGTFRGMGGIFRIDYILHSKEFKSIKYSNPNIKISDHKPVVSELVYR